SRQRLQRGDVDPYQPGLVKRADQVLAAGMIDRRLATDAGIDLGEQRGRHLYEGDAALKGGGREAGQVADDPAAEGDDRRVAVEARVDQPIVQERQPGEVFVLFAVRHLQHGRLEAR